MVWCIVLVCFRVGVLVFCLFVFVRCFGSFVFLVSALRVFRAVTRLTVYRALRIFEISSVPTLVVFSILFFNFLKIYQLDFDKFHLVFAF